jgi:hypothetical protein
VRRGIRFIRIHVSKVVMTVDAHNIHSVAAGKM